MESYELVIAEILLQQTGAARVAQHFSRFLALFPTWVSLAAADAAIVEEALRPLGLQRRRSSALLRLARAIVELGDLPRTAEELAALPGIGQYISRAIALQLEAEHVAPIDANVARVLERLFGSRELADIRFDPGLQALALELFAEPERRDFFYSILDFAAETCTAQDPSCSTCPVKRCRYRSSNADRVQEVDCR